MNRNCSTLKKHLPEILILLFIAGCILCFSLLQPVTDPPDEVSRYKIARFICNHLTLPRGDEFEVAIGGYGGSYAYFPILPYILMGYLTKLGSFFTASPQLLLVLARLVNVSFALIMAVFVRKSSCLLFSEEVYRWCFFSLVMFLPQLLFLHSYVNTDSMAALSGSIILYACLEGRRAGFSRKICALLALGCCLCILSYYNSYGLLIMAFLLFISGCRSRREFISGAIFTLFLVFLGSGWWFIRSAILYDGDFLGLSARAENAARTALPQYNPALRISVKDSGTSLYDMLFGMDFLYYVWNSFVARFGPMTIPTCQFLYIWYYRIFTAGIIGCLLPLTFLKGLWQKMVSSRKNSEFAKNGLVPAFKNDSYFIFSRNCFYLAMLAGIAIPWFLSIYYSYTSDYQPQGRYVMPMLLPFMFLVCLGLSKLSAFVELLLVRSGLSPLCRYWKYIIPVLTTIFMTVALLLTIFRVVLPTYLGSTNLWNSPWAEY